MLLLYNPQECKQTKRVLKYPQTQREIFALPGASGDALIRLMDC
jgi:hypothetical protein